MNKAEENEGKKAIVVGVVDHGKTTLTAAIEELDLKDMSIEEQKERGIMMITNTYEGSECIPSSNYFNGKSARNIRRKEKRKNN
tara:strand:- start:2 stop:253 length:252 start_codon:yes stop_codon:yes gene_type:complete